VRLRFDAMEIVIDAVSNEACKIKSKRLKLTANGVICCCCGVTQERETLSGPGRFGNEDF